MPTTLDTPDRRLDGAEWISRREDHVPPAGERPAAVFRRTFEVAGEVGVASLVATAHGVYEAFLNGVRVGDAELTPGLTSYQATLQVQRYDVTALLVPGVNELRIVLSDGWFRGRCGASRIPDNYGTATSVIARLEATLDGAAPLIVATDPAWQVGVGEIVAADLMDGQVVDLRRRDAIAWAPAILSLDPLTRVTGRYVWSDAPPVRRTASYPPTSVTRLASGRQIVDFGTTVNGWVRLRDLGPAGAETVLKHGEWLTPDGDLDTAHVAYGRWPSDEILTTGQLDRVTSRGVEADVFEPRHTTHGFRFVAIDGRDDDLDPTTLEAVLLRSDLASTLVFETNDEDLDRLHAITVQSWLANTCDVPTDCPQRERWGYTGDFQIFVHTAAFLEDIEGFSAKWLRSLADDQAESGLITNVAPMCGIDPIIPVSLDGAAGWGDAATMVPWEIYRAYGDERILEQTIGMMRRWVDFVEHRAATERHGSRIARHPEPQAHERSIWDTGWQWGEWAEPDLRHDADADQGIVATAYFHRSAAILSAALLKLGDAASAARYAELAEQVKRAWSAEFFDPSTDRLAVDRQANYVRALAFDLVPADHRAALLDRLVALIEDADDHLTTGFLATGLLLPVLADGGRIDVAYRLLRQRTPPSWLTMLDRGATAVWEAWEGVDDEGRAHDSLAHYSKGAVITFLHEYVAGLRQHPDSVGWERFVVDPQPDEHVTEGDLRYRSRHGLIRVAWRSSGPDLDVTVVVPEGCSAELLSGEGVAVPLEPGTHRRRIARSKDDLRTEPTVVQQLLAGQVSVDGASKQMDDPDKQGD